MVGTGCHDWERARTQQTSSRHFSLVHSLCNAATRQIPSHTWLDGNTLCVPGSSHVLSQGTPIAQKNTHWRRHLHDSPHQKLAPDTRRCKTSDYTKLVRHRRSVATLSERMPAEKLLDQTGDKPDTHHKTKPVKLCILFTLHEGLAARLQKPTAAQKACVNSC